MKEDTSKGKSQEKQSGSPPQSEEDLDFEILDALEQIGQPGEASDTASTDQEDEFDLNLDDDIIFDEGHLGETEEFRAGTDTPAPMESDEESAEAESVGITENFHDFSVDADIGDEEEIDYDSETFSLDLDQETGENLDISFDDDIDLDLDGTFEESSFDTDNAELGIISTEPGITSPEAGIISPEAGIISPEADIISPEADIISTEPGISEDSLESGVDSQVTPPQDSLDMTGEEEMDESSDNMDEDIDIENLPDLEDAMAEFNTALDDSEGELDTERENMEHETEKISETEEFSGKGVIAIDGEEVFDLGNEDDISSITDADSASWDDEGLSEENGEDVDVDLAELAKGAQELVSTVMDETDEQDEDFEKGDEDFMASLDDINIDLHDEDVDEDLDTFGGDVDVDNLDLPEEEGASEAELSEEEFEVSNISEALAEVQTETGIEGGIEEEEHADISEEAEEPELDVREALGLVPRLSDTEIEKFEQMVIEAKTLQQYVEELDEHKPEIKTSIYSKLFKEYTERKADIFREPEFISIRIDVEQDLEDMLRKQSDVQGTITTLTDELEEVQVRHLVGEYSDQELAEQEISRKTDIEEWQQKAERLESFILQYQELLETEKALNPIEEETPESLQEAELGLDSEESGMVEEEASFDEVASLPEEEAVGEADDSVFNAGDLVSKFEDAEAVDEAAADISMDDLSQEIEDTEAADEAAADISMDDLSQEIEDMAELADILDAEGGEDWEEGEENDIELTAETFDSDDFSLDDDFSGLEEDFELESSTGDEVDEVEGQEEGQEEEMISCKKCGRSTPASEKFCVNCGAKAQ